MHSRKTLVVGFQSFNNIPTLTAEERRCIDVRDLQVIQDANPLFTWDGYQRQHLKGSDCATARTPL